MPYQHRCGQCKAYVLPHADHPIFTVGSGGAVRSAGDTTLQRQSAVLLCASLDVCQAHCAQLLDINHKAVERIYAANDLCRRRYVEKEEKKIVYGAEAEWNDVEADEVDVKGDLVENHKDAPADAKVEWEQWGGVVERGFPRTLKLARLCPKRTKNVHLGLGQSASLTGSQLRNET